MYEIILSVVFGVIEGLTEFLPISSTAHLRIAQWLTLKDGLTNPFWKMYAIVIQFGAILAVVVFFWRRLLKFLRTFPRGESGDRTFLNHPLTLVGVAFVCTVVPVLVWKSTIDKNLEDMSVIGCSLLVGGVVMWVVDVLFERARTLEVERMSLPQSICVGLAQSLAAIFPGLSRSMATIAAGQVTGLSRAAALEFSFFLCIPTMAAATAKEMKDFLKYIAAPEVQLVMSPHRWLVLAVGFVVSFLVAWVVIAWFLAWVRKHGFIPFAIYRVLLGLAILVSLRLAAK